MAEEKAAETNQKRGVQTLRATAKQRVGMNCWIRARFPGEAIQLISKLGQEADIQGKVWRAAHWRGVNSSKMQSVMKKPCCREGC